MLLIQTINRSKLFVMQRTGDMTGLDEQAVVTLAILGDQMAFEELVRRRQGWLRTLLRRLCGDPHLADDLAQQAFLQAWRTIKSLKSSQAFAAWMKRLAVNTWLQHLRKNDPLNNTVENDDQRAAHEHTGAGIDLDRALASLPRPVRLCIVLAYNEGMSHSEIADVTDMPLGTVKSHITRGTKKLQDFLAAYDNNRPDTAE